jgi:drug/metabolite transporter (DMT)-like permease
MVGEVLSFINYIGFLVIILSSTLLTLNTCGKLKLNKSFFWMALCSIILSVEAVVYKYVFTQVNWVTGFTWATVLSFILVLPLILLRKHKMDIKSQFSKFKNKFYIFVIEELLTFGGAAAGTFAISIASVTLVSGIISIQPIFVLAYAILFSGLFPKIFKEKITVRSIAKKLILFAVMILGIILITH